MTVKGGEYIRDVEKTTELEITIKVGLRATLWS